jgi:hypothetical protein
VRKTIPLCGQYGVIKDQPEWELPINAWSDARNVAFKGSVLSRIAGQQQVFTTPTITPYFVASHQTATKRYWVHAGLAKVFVDDGTTRTEITGSAPTGAIDDRWSGGTLNGIWAMTNGKDLPMAWDNNTANNLATMTAWDTNERCAVLVPFKTYWIALDITKTSTRYPYMIKWSNAAVPGANPTTWDETDVTEEAGEQDAGETGDLIVDGKPLGDALIIYKQNSRVAMRQTFDERIFSFHPLPGGGGALNRGCVADTPLGHMVFGNGDLYLHKGGEPFSICDDMVREEVFNNLDSTYAERAFVAVYPSKNEVWFCYPEVGESACTMAAVYNYTAKTWTFRDLPDVTYAASGLLEYAAADSWDADSGTWDTDTSTWDQNEFTPNEPRLIMATTAPRLDLADSGGTFAGTAFTAYAERVGLVPEGEASRVLVLNKIVPRFDAPDGTVILIEAGGAMSAKAAPTWTFSYSFTVGTDEEAYGFATGKFLAVKFSSTDSRIWRVKSYDIEYEDGGAY